MTQSSQNDKYVSAWRCNPAWKSHFLSSAARELSKTGSLDADEAVLRRLAPSLSVDEAREIYAALQLSFRPDDEWQDQFLTVFATVTRVDLPRPIIDLAESERLARQARAESEARLAKERNQT